MIAEAELPVWVVVIERLGISTAIIVFGGFLVLMIFKALLPPIKKRVEAGNKLTIALSEELPRMSGETHRVALSTETIAKNTEKLFETSVQHNKTINMRLDKIEDDLSRTKNQEG